jgi:malate dehydrogenase
VRSIVILGAGELGGALARQLAAADVAARVTLVDGAGSVAAGKALDILQAAPVDGYATLVDGTTDEAAVVGADLIVIADRAGVTGPAAAAEWQDDAGVGLVRRAIYLNNTTVLCAGARQLELIERGVREIGISRQRLFGSAPEALRSAVVSFTALEANCDPGDVSLTVVGRPPGQIIVPWDDASIAGRCATDVLSPPALTRLDGRLARLWPPGPMTLGAAATRVIATMATRGRRALSLFVSVPREEGGRGHSGMLPALVGDDGLVTVVAPTLSTRDRVRLDSALQR